MRINTNVSSLVAQEANVQVNKNLSASLEKLSTGLKINKASDDASGMSIADKLRTQASSLGQAIKNANSGSALIQIADKAMAEQSNILDIVKTKLIQAATETTSAEGREAIRKDIQKLLDQLDNIAEQTNYNGISLLSTKGKTFSFQVGDKASDSIATSTAYASNTQGLGGGANKYTEAQTIEPSNAMNIAISSTAATDGSEDIVKISQKTTGTTGDRMLDVSANNVMQISLARATAVGEITFTVEDSKTRDSLISNAGSNDNLSYDKTTKEFTFKQTAAGADATIKFAAPQDIGTLHVKGLAAGSTGETLSFKNTLAHIDSDSGLGTLTINNKLTDAAGVLTDTLQVSGTGDETLTGGELLVNLKNLEKEELTSKKANSFMIAIDKALTQLNTVRSDFGSTQNQLESSIRNMATTKTNIKAAESVIRDVDYAQESANFNKQNIIAQAGTYAMSQANQVQQNVLKLLQ